MIGSAAPAMHQAIMTPAMWILKNKLNLLKQKKIEFQACIRGACK
jgi:hypothetical protein